MIERFKNLLLCCLVLFLPWFHSRTTLSAFRLPQETFAILLIMVWISLTIWEDSKNTLLKTSLSKRLTLPVLIVIIVSFCSLFGAKNLGLAGKHFYLFSGYLIFFLLLTNSKILISKNSFLKRNFYKITTLMLFSSSIAALYGIFQAFGYDPFVQPIFPNLANRYLIGAFIGEPTTYAAFLSITIPVSTVLFLWEDKIWLLGFYLIHLSLAIAAILTTQTRTAILAVAGAMVLVCFFSIRAKKKKNSLKNLKRSALLGRSAMLILILIICIYLAWKLDPAFEQRLRNFLDISTDQSGCSASVSLRLVGFRTALEMIRENPLLGVGLGNYQSCFTEVLEKLILAEKIRWNFSYVTMHQAHNEFLQFSAEVGILGLLGILWLLFILLGIFLKFIPSQHPSKNPQTLEAYKFSSLGLGVLVAAFINSLASFPFHIAVCATYVVVWVSLSLRLSSERSRFANKKNKKG